MPRAARRQVAGHRWRKGRVVNILTVRFAAQENPRLLPIPHCYHVVWIAALRQQQKTIGTANYARVNKKSAFKIPNRSIVIKLHRFEYLTSGILEYDYLKEIFKYLTSRRCRVSYNTFLETVLHTVDLPVSQVGIGTRRSLMQHSNDFHSWPFVDYNRRINSILAHRYVISRWIFLPVRFNYYSYNIILDINFKTIY